MNTTGWREHCLSQLEYQAWANQLLFNSLARLHADVLDTDQGLPFTSIHRTVETMLATLRLWASRLHEDTPTARFTPVHEPDWPALKHQLQHELRELRRQLEAQPEAFFHHRILYTRANGLRTSNYAIDILQHLAAYLAHHRGQLYAVATRLGGPAPLMGYLHYLREMDKAAREARENQPSP